MSASTKAAVSRAPTEEKELAKEEKKMKKEEGIKKKSSWPDIGSRAQRWRSSPFIPESSLPPPPLPFSLFKVTLANVIFHESFSIYQGQWLAEAARECLTPLDFI